MLISLSKTLQCSEREVVRIALYEESKSASNAYESTFTYTTRSVTTEKSR